MSVVATADVLTEIGRHRVLPVVVVPRADVADRLGDVLVDGGLPLVEITMRTPFALDALRRLARRTDLLVGAGTVTVPDQVDRVVEAGARYVVSPGFSPGVVARCHELGVPALPGVATATELQAAIDAGVGTVKFFPAQAAGGPGMIRALSGPFGDVRFVPTGGISPVTVSAYLEIPQVLAVGGSWMVAPSMMRPGGWHFMTDVVRDAVAVAQAVAR